MPLRRLLHQLFHNEQFIQKLSESPPLRLLARISVTKYNEISEIVNKMKVGQNGQKLFESWQNSAQRFNNLFREELKKALEEKKQSGQAGGRNKKS